MTTRPEDAQLALDLGIDPGPAQTAAHRLRLHDEVELKFTVSSSAALPDLSSVSAVGPTTEFELSALYFDTPELDLVRAGSSLRRRQGGSDSGWHLKTAGLQADHRTELHAPLDASDGAGEPPAELRAALPHPLRDAPLEPVARLVTLRRLTPLLDAGGAVLAEVCDDRVWTQVPPASEGEEAWHRNLDAPWREVEVELVGGERPLLEAVAALLIQWGAVPGTYGSKVARALAHPGLSLRKR